MKKLKKLLENTFVIISAFIIIWVIWSVANINLHNDIISGDKNFSKYNLFEILFPEEDCVIIQRESKEMAAHEEKKANVDIIKETNINDLTLLAHLLQGECGARWCSDDMQYYVGSIALNRVKSDKFPNTLQEVIFQDGQYASTWDGNFNLEPSDRSWQIAQELLDEGSVLPENVLFQAEFLQGSGVYVKEQNMYFCYQ